MFTKSFAVYHLDIWSSCYANGKLHRGVFLQHYRELPEVSWQDVAESKRTRPMHQPQQTELSKMLYFDFKEKNLNTLGVLQASVQSEASGYGGYSAAIKWPQDNRQ